MARFPAISWDSMNWFEDKDCRKQCLCVFKFKGFCICSNSIQTILEWWHNFVSLWSILATCSGGHQFWENNGCHMLYIQWQIRKTQIIWHHHDSAGTEHYKTYYLYPCVCYYDWIISLKSSESHQGHCAVVVNQNRPQKSPCVLWVGSGRAWFDGHPHG